MTQGTRRLYFGYGSNLWLEQMALRCLGSDFIGIGRLPRYRWMINSRGYANVAETNNPQNSTNNNKDEEEAEEVWGLVYALSEADEKQLDVNEGVPFAYEKRVLEVECLWESSDGNGGKKERTKEMVLVYIDFKRADGEGNLPRAEYVYRMNMGIGDALRKGVPRGYVDKVLRRWIPEEAHQDKDGESMKVKELARKQAVSFKDESGVYRGGERTG
ncbi:hypothetical protein B0H66DRAFT_71653 [Apodospora peruviana]|uniref:gamma-glutamylcyclotransferase n=1 Tax=Apodospora peruviana TaxID=516989 RepID=A0AAE0ISX2_9PEZI|nr:hypothetical protein B0H66DRAFT_71653 [Apodospora peruviana]